MLAKSKSSILISADHRKESSCRVHIRTLAENRENKLLFLFTYIIYSPISARDNDGDPADKKLITSELL